MKSDAELREVDALIAWVQAQIMDPEFADIYLHLTYYRTALQWARGADGPNIESFDRMLSGLRLQRKKTEAYKWN
jgi:hypothetical protein